MTVLQPFPDALMIEELRDPATLAEVETALQDRGYVVVAKELADNVLIRQLTAKGYRVRSKDDMKHQLSWHRAPAIVRPTGVGYRDVQALDDFKREALAKIREQITVEHLDVVEREDGVRSAYLHIL